MFFNKKQDKTLKYQKMENLLKFKNYVEKNHGWICGCENLWFKSQRKKCLVCHFVNRFLLIFEKKKEEKILLIKQLFKKYKYQFTYVDHYLDLC